VVIWDTGFYELAELKEGKITFFLKGKNLRGVFTLTFLKGRGKGNQWLLIKKRDEYAHHNWRLETGLTPEKKARLRELIPPCKTA